MIAIHSEALVEAKAVLEGEHQVWDCDGLPQAYKFIEPEHDQEWVEQHEEMHQPQPGVQLVHQRISRKV